VQFNQRMESIEQSLNASGLNPDTLANDRSHYETLEKMKNGLIVKKN